MPIPDSFIVELVGQALLIGRVQQAWTQDTVHPDRAIDHLAGERVLLLIPGSRLLDFLRTR